MSATQQMYSTPSTLNVPLCRSCGQPMQWKRTRRSFTATGIGTLESFACDECGEVFQREIAGPSITEV